MFLTMGRARPLKGSTQRCQPLLRARLPKAHSGPFSPQCPRSGPMWRQDSHQRAKRGPTMGQGNRTESLGHSHPGSHRKHFNTPLFNNLHLPLPANGPGSA